MKRVITYDIKEGNSYDDFYDFIDRFHGVKITKSTYIVETNLKQAEFEEKLKNIFSKGDNVAYISVNEDSQLFYTKIKPN